MAILERMQRSTRSRWRQFFSDRNRLRVGRHRLPAGEVTVVGPLVRPIGINIDRSGRILIAEFDRHRIIRLTAACEFDSWLGAPGDASAEVAVGWRQSAGPARRGNEIGAFSRPHGIDLDEDGNIYVTELDNRRVQVFAENGLPARVIPAPVSTSSVSLKTPETFVSMSFGMMAPPAIDI